MQTQSGDANQTATSTVDRDWGDGDRERGAQDLAYSRHQRGPQQHSARGDAERRARQLGYFSLALGLAELTLSGKLAQLIGLEDTRKTRSTLKAMGVREIAHGVGLVTQPQSAGFVWSRVAGDALDLALLGKSLADGAANRTRLVAATAAVAGVTALDVVSAARLSRNAAVQKVVGPIHVVRSITINRSPETVYRIWRDLENLPRFMDHLESVVVEDGYSTWRAKAPAGTSIEWRAEITLDRPNETLAWRSLEGASVPNRGVVRFKPGPAGRGTQVLVELKYEPPGGAIGAAIAKLFGEEPAQQIAGDLRRLKQVLETGSIVHSDASIHRGPHPARPPADGERTTLDEESEL